MTSIPSEASPATVSVAQNSIARLLVLGGRAAFGLISGIITARALGPAGKGQLSSMLYAITLLSYGCSLGFGESATVKARGDIDALRAWFSRSLFPVAVVTATAALAWIPIASRIWPDTGYAIGTGSILIVLMTVVWLLMGFEAARERIVFTSKVTALQLGVEFAFLAALVLLFDLGVTGGVLAAVIGAVVAVVILASAARMDRFSFLPLIDLPFLAGAMKRSVVLEFSFLLSAVAQRIDLLVVYVLLGASAAGIYSISLTVGLLAAFVGGSLSYAAFPRMARLSGSSEDAFLFRAIRVNVAVTALTSVGMMLFAPILIPTAFGSRFTEAVVPSLVLLAGACGWSLLTLLNRSAWSRGKETFSMASYSLTIASMVLLDLLLIPSFGLIGAAIGSVAATTIGLSFCWVGLRGSFASPDEARWMPRAKDLRFVRRSAWRVTRAIMPARRKRDEAA